MIVNETFYSIQGEGTQTGLPMAFIRLTGCNLRCKWCDTKYAYYEGEEKSIEEIFNSCRKYNTRYVCITGGEPLIQKDTTKLIQFFLKKNYFVLLETNGSIDIKPCYSYIKKNLKIALDIKCPSSGMHKKMKFSNISHLRKNDDLKFVIGNERDYEYAKNIIRKYKTNANIIFQPVGGLNAKGIAKKVLLDRLNVRVMLQLHKIIFGGEDEKNI
ncbi:MAG: radical SAM protein [Candidatus Thermoplasmatota archaeon]